MEITSCVLKKKKPFLSSKQTLRLELQAAITQPELSRLSFEMQKLLLPSLNNERTLKNCKGRNGELFFFSGAIPTDPDEIKSKDGVSFEYSITSEFSHLERPGVFIEKLGEHFLGDLSEDIEPGNLTWLAPVFPKILRIGMEFYRSSFYSSSLGLAPALSEYFEVHADTALRFIVHNDSFVHGSPGLLSDTSIWERLMKAFATSTGIDISPQILIHT